MSPQSESSQCRDRLREFFRGSGVDLGCGGGLVVPHAIGVDMPNPYTKVGDDPIHLRGDARVLHWFTDGCLDFVFSSHLLEDFPAEETVSILHEWQRPLKIGGHLVIYCPDEQIFREHCEKTGQPHNGAHQIPDFSAAFVVGALRLLPWMEVVHVAEHVDTYAFEVVARKGAQ